MGNLNFHLPNTLKNSSNFEEPFESRITVHNARMGFRIVGMHRLYNGTDLCRKKNLPRIARKGQRLLRHYSRQRIHRTMGLSNFQFSRFPFSQSFARARKKSCPSKSTLRMFMKVEKIETNSKCLIFPLLVVVFNTLS